MVTWHVEAMYEDSFGYIDLQSIEKDFGVSINEVFERNNINNSLDLMYNIILYSQKEINSSSSKNEIIDNFVFEYYRPLILPYTKDSTINKIIFFTGDKYGYANITDDTLIINLKLDDDEYRIAYAYSDDIQHKLTEEEIINIVSTVKFN